MLYEAIKRLRPGVHFELTEDGTRQGPYISVWDSESEPPSQVEIDAMIATLEAEREAAQTEANALRTRVVNLAQSAVGVQIDALTAGQVRALVALLLWESGGIDKTGAIKPLSQWVR